MRAVPHPPTPPTRRARTDPVKHRRTRSRDRRGFRYSAVCQRENSNGNEHKLESGWSIRTMIPARSCLTAAIRTPHGDRELSQGVALNGKAGSHDDRVLDEARSLHFYARAFGSKWRPSEISGLALIYLRHPSSPFEVRADSEFRSQGAHDLGDGYGHIAVGRRSRCRTRRFEREKLSPGRCAISSMTARHSRAFSSSPIPTATNRGNSEGWPLG